MAGSNMSGVSARSVNKPASCKPGLMPPLAIGVRICDAWPRNSAQMPSLRVRLCQNVARKGGGVGADALGAHGLPGPGRTAQNRLDLAA